MKIFSTPQKGFTLIEMIIVMVLVGIIGGMIAMFIRAPVQSYIDSSRRAGLTDMADTAIRRVGRDLRTAVPNSVRMVSWSTSPYVEFLPTRVAGMFQNNPVSGVGVSCIGTLDANGFTYANSCFSSVAPISMVASPPDYIVLGSNQSNAVPPYDPTSGVGVLRQYAGTSGSVQAISYPASAFPSWVPISQNFQVVPGDQQAVTYACMLNGASSGTPAITPGTDANGNGQGQLIRYWKYGFNATQVAPPLATGLYAILVDHVSYCNIVYSTDYQNNGLVAITLQLTQSGESVLLYDEIHVSNQP